MTMFNQLDIQGFKSFEYASLSLHPLTILTGLKVVVRALLFKL